jgi:four helix bundle protein
VASKERRIEIKKLKGLNFTTMLNLSHKKLEVYRLSLKLIKEVYLVTKTFPKEEQYVLVSQIRRAAISVCSNLAEGASRISKPDKRKFYIISRSSLVEMDTQFEIAMVLGYYKAGQMKELEQYLESVFRILCKLIDNLGADSDPH